jgi:hypothetical protein
VDDSLLGSRQVQPLPWAICHRVLFLHVDGLPS